MPCKGLWTSLVTVVSDLSARRTQRRTRSVHEVHEEFEHRPTTRSKRVTGQENGHFVLLHDSWCRLKSRRIGKYVIFVHCTRNCITASCRRKTWPHVPMPQSVQVTAMVLQGPGGKAVPVWPPKSGDLPVTSLLYDTTTGYSQAKLYQLSFLSVSDLAPSFRF